MTYKTDQELEDEIKALEAQLANRKAEQKRRKWPIKTDFYAHVHDEENMEDAAKYFERGTPAFETYCSTGYEIEFSILIHEDGTVKATHVNGTALVEPVEI